MKTFKYEINYNNNMNSFNENYKELWYFPVHRPIGQYLLFFIFKSISKIKEIKQKHAKN